LPKRTRSTELAALTSIAAQVNCTQDLGEILAGALGTTLEVIGEESGEIFLVDEETGDLLLHTHKGLSEAFVAAESVIGYGECICGQAVQSGRIDVITDLATHPARSREACMGEGFQSCIRLPLLARGEVLGLLNIQSRAARHFTADDVELLTAIGNQIGIAIANAQLIDDAERRRATLDSVMNSLVDGLILVDSGGKITYWNPRATEFLGIPAAVAMGRPAMGVARRIAMGSTQPERVSEQLADALLHFQTFPVIEYELLRPQRRTVQSLLFPITGDNGQDLGYGITLRDVSREKELDRMKLQLLSTVSHELRTPLASIKGFTTSLLREDVRWDEKTQRDFLQIIDQESDRLAELIGNLLDMSRIDTGTLAMEKELIQIRTLLQEAIEATKPHTTKHTFVLDVPRRIPTTMADPRRIRQVVHNLLGNAVKYSPDGGRVTIRASLGLKYLTVSVTDQGIGIPKRYHDRIFERFFQVDSASTRRVGGSGLGLAICKSIIEAHGGRIWVESEPEQGSTVSFTLPLNPSS